MAKTKSSTNWVRNLRAMMEQRGFNPRSLSLAAGLNATAVRDMLEGRSKSPRYDTAQALAGALDTTPAALMGDEAAAAEMGRKGPGFREDLELLTEIIARLQETAEEDRRVVSPREFAAIVATLYRSLRGSDKSRRAPGVIKSQVYELLDYETLRQKGRR
jgi:transcriptional regulator with XRE-family HTH domain